MGNRYVRGWLGYGQGETGTVGVRWAIFYTVKTKMPAIAPSEAFQRQLSRAYFGLSLLVLKIRLRHKFCLYKIEHVGSRAPHPCGVGLGHSAPSR